MTQPLSELRSRIDAVDDQIFALLKQRIEVVRQVGELKSKDKSNRCFLRSGREADIVRRAYDEFKTSLFTPQAAANMWRQIIMASLNVESPLKVSVCASDNGNSSLYWLAREYFGSFTPLRREPSAARVVADVVEGRAHVGVLPLPAESAKEDWWLSLVREADLPKVFAIVPFVTTRSEFKKSGALAIAYVEPEQTADDVSLYGIKLGTNTSQGGLNAIFTKAGLQVNWCAAATPHPDRRLHLIEVKGFHPAGSAAMENLRAEIGAGLPEMIYIGSYASPIFTD